MSAGLWVVPRGHCSHLARRVWWFVGSPRMPLQASCSSTTSSAASALLWHSHNQQAQHPWQLPLPPVAADAVFAISVKKATGNLITRSVPAVWLIQGSLTLCSQVIFSENWRHTSSRLNQKTSCDMCAPELPQHRPPVLTFNPNPKGALVRMEALVAFYGMIMFLPTWYRWDFLFSPQEYRHCIYNCL